MIEKHFFTIAREIFTKSKKVFYYLIGNISTGDKGIALSAHSGIQGMKWRGNVFVSTHLLFE